MIQQRGKVYTYEQLKQIYDECGYILLSDYQTYLNNGRSHARLDCMNKKTGYKYSVNVVNLRHEFSGKNKFDSRNPFRLENLQKWCDENDLKVKIIQVEKVGRRCVCLVQCSCGQEFSVNVDKFIAGKNRCDICISKESKFELMTRKWLEEHNIYFEQEYKFPDCKNKRCLPFDFMVKRKEEILLIEVDGFQHFYENQYTSKERLAIQQQNDKIKDEYCEKNNYKLIRLPYWWFRTDKYKEVLSKTFLDN